MVIVFVIVIFSVFVGLMIVLFRKLNFSISCKVVFFSFKVMDINFRSVCEFFESIIYNFFGF